MRDFYRINEARESSIFLCLGPDNDNPLEEWAFGVGNISHLIRTTEQSQDALNPKEALLDELSDVLETTRSTEPVIVTPNSHTLATLHRDLLTNDELETQSLRGTRQIDLETILLDHFDGVLPISSAGFQQRNDSIELSPENLSEIEPNQSGIETLWQVLTTIAPVVPARALIGEPL